MTRPTVNSPNPDNPRDPAATPTDLHELLDRYLDDQLSPAERAAFESRAKSDPTISALLAAETRADAFVRTEFSPPDMELRSVLTDEIALQQAAQEPDQGLSPELGRESDHHSNSATPPPPKPIRSQDLSTIVRTYRKPLSLAAVLALAAGAVIFGPDLYRSPAASLYHDFVARNVQPSWICETNEDLRRYTREVFEHELTLASTPTGTRVVGWTSSNTLGQYTSVLIAQVDGKPVFVMVQLESRYRPARDWGHGGLQTFERRATPFIFIEITPHDAPHLLDSLQPHG
jgi:hypothetical protein